MISLWLCALGGFIKILKFYLTQRAQSHREGSFFLNYLESIVTDYQIFFIEKPWQRAKKPRTQINRREFLMLTFTYKLASIVTIFFFCTFLLHCQDFQKSQSILEKIAALPPEEKELLKMLFIDLFRVHGFAHALYGSKSIALTDYHVDEIKKNISIDSYCKDLLNREGGAPVSFYLKGWKIWEKYQHLFKTPLYILKKHQISNSNSIFLILINKKAFLQTVKKNIKSFKRILGKAITPDHLLEEIEKEEIKFFELLKYDEELIGILLGYGQHNAQLFKRREEIYNFLERKKISLDFIANFQGLENIHQELNNLQSKLHLFNPAITLPMADTFTPSFLADRDHSETIELRIVYQKIRPSISRLFDQEDWFEHILLQLTSDREK